MNQQTSTECPHPKVLIQFLRGKLQPAQLVHCETHLKDCVLCHETLVGLSSDDTLSERIVAALQSKEAENFLNDSSGETESLLNRLMSEDFKLSAIAADPSRGQKNRTAETEMIADRAAEVLRCVTPSEDSLGTLGDFTLVRLIGAGSTGVVFQAIDETLERTVALKVMRPSLGEISRDRFLVEAKLAASIEHVNVVTIFQVGRVDRLAFMTMPWLPGQTLESLLACDTQLNDDQIIEIIGQIAAGLDAAHQKQLVHRDIKPANLWICEDDQRLKILDFGLARISDDNPNLTATGMLAGTPNFMSPEQTRGLELDGRSDLFSLGCVLYRLLAGRLPFGSPTVLATLSSIQSHSPVPPAELSKDINQDLSDLTMCLLEKQPINRPHSSEQLIELLAKPRNQWPMVVPSYSSANVTNNPTNQPPVTEPIKASSGQGWSSWVPVVLGLLMLGFGSMFAPQIFRVVTNEGEVVIETSDDNVSVEVLQDEKVVRVIDSETQQSFSLKSGQYSFHAKATDGATANSFTIEPDALTMHRGERAIVKVTVKPNKEATTEPAASVAPAPATENHTLLFNGRTFAQWLQTAKFDRAPGAKVVAALGCVQTATTDEEWAQALHTTALLMNEGKNVNDVILAVDADHLFDFLKTQIAPGRTTRPKLKSSWMLLNRWLGLHIGIKEPRPPLPWKQINELTDAIGQNADTLGVLQLIEPFLLEQWSHDGPGIETYLTNLRKSPAGLRIKELALTGNLQERFNVYRLALKIFDSEDILEIYKNDLLDPNLNHRSFKWDSSTSKPQPWPKFRPILFMEIYRSMDPDRYRTLNNSDTKAEAKYVSEVADLLIKVTDGFLEKRLPFSISTKVASWPTGFLRTTNFVFFDVAQRTSDENLKRRLLEKLEAIGDSIDPEARANDDEKSLLEDLEYLIALYKGDPPSQLPLGTFLKMRKPKEKPTNQVEQIASVTTAPSAEINKPIYNGRTFAQWLQVAKFDSADGARSAAALGCAKMAETDEQWAEVLKVTALLIEDNEQVRDVVLAIDADHLFDFFKSQIAQGKIASPGLLSRWLGLHFEVKKPRPPLPWKRINELTDVISQNADKPGGLKLIKPILFQGGYDQGPDMERYLTNLRVSPAGKRIKERALTGNLQERFDISGLALEIFNTEDVLAIYKNDLLDPALNNRPVKWYSTSHPWPVFRPRMLLDICKALEPTHYRSFNDGDVDAKVEAKYVSEASDLLIQVADGFLEKRLLFSKPVEGQNAVPTGLLSTMNIVSFDLAQRTSDKDLKQHLLKKLEAIRDSLDSKALASGTDNDDGHLMALREKTVKDLDYVIAFYKDGSPSKLPRGSHLKLRNQKEKLVDKVDQEDRRREDRRQSSRDRKREPQRRPSSGLDAGVAKTTAEKIKPVYQSKTFDQWIEIARYDRAPETQSNALKACATLVETKQEREQILVPIRDIARKFGHYGNTPYPALRRGLDSVSEDQILDFISTEISEGTQESQSFCRRWLEGIWGTRSAAESISSRSAKLNAVRNRLPEIADVIVANFSKPDVAQIGIIHLGILKNTKVSDKVKELVRTGTLQQRFDIRKTVLEVFIDDEEVFEIYSRDLLSPDLNDASVKIEKRYADSKIRRPASAPWGAGRVELAERIFSVIFKPRETGDPLKADASTVAKRIEAAANLLANATDGLLADGEKRVLYNEDRGPVEYHGKELKANVVPKWMIQGFYDIGRQSDDSELKQLLLKKLENIQKRVDELPRAQSKKREFQLIKSNLRYLVALYKGNPPAERPEGSSIRDRD